NRFRSPFIRRAAVGFWRRIIMNALRDFVAYVKATAPSGPKGQTPKGQSGAPVQAGPAPAGPEAPAAGSGGGRKPAASSVGYNPGNHYWSVITANDLESEAESASAGGIRQRTEYADYEGWQDSEWKITTKASQKFPIVQVAHHVSARVRGHPKDDPDNDRYIA